MDISYKRICTMSKEETGRVIIATYLAKGHLSQIARLWHTSRPVVRKWVRRYQEQGGLWA